ncbi:MAG: hypothetical protein ACFFDN_00335 [Candidatus Hodarchaeota archaeon]
MVRVLRTSEKKYTKIQHKEVKTIVMIVGSYIGGFLVSDVDMKQPFPLKLPFDKISEWEVI